MRRGASSRNDGASAARSIASAYTYDAAGFQASQVYPDGSEVAITRWDDGRVRTLGGFVAEAQYDDAGLLTLLRHANGVEESFAYDPAGTIEEMRVARGAQLLRHARLTHDAAGRLTSNEELVGPHAGSEACSFDALGRLVRFRRDQSANGGGVTTHEYAYDADGNMLRGDEMGAPQFEYDFSAPGALQRRRRPDGTIEEFEFDAAGQLTATGDMQLVFDARGRLTRAVKADGTIVEMVYDYRGARLSKRVTGSPQGNYEVRYVDDLVRGPCRRHDRLRVPERTPGGPAARRRRSPPSYGPSRQRDPRDAPQRSGGRACVARSVRPRATDGPVGRLAAIRQLRPGRGDGTLLLQPPLLQPVARAVHVSRPAFPGAAGARAGPSGGAQPVRLREGRSDRLRGSHGKGVLEHPRESARGGGRGRRRRRGGRRRGRRHRRGDGVRRVGDRARARPCSGPSSAASKEAGKAR